MLLSSQLKMVRTSEIVFLFQKYIFVIATTHVLVSTSKPCVSRVTLINTLSVVLLVFILGAGSPQIKCFVSCPISIVCGILQLCFIPGVP